MTAFPLDEIRARFPALSREQAGRAPIHFDNPAGTQVPRAVIDAVADALGSGASNLGGSFDASRRADAIWDAAHRAAADFLGARAEDVVIGPSMTGLTFAMSRALGRRFRPGDEIIVTAMDHEGNVSPWLRLARDRDLVVKWVDVDPTTWRIEPKALAEKLSPRTRLAALSYASNMTGVVNPIAELAALARRAGAFSYVDAVQFAPHGLIDVAALGCDFLVCSSYKFYGPHLGILWGAGERLAEIDADRCRCSPKEGPGKFETGTPQTELLAGLAAAIDHWAWIGAAVGASGERRAVIRAAHAAAGCHERALFERLLDGLRGLGLGAILGPEDLSRTAERAPTLSFSPKDAKPSAIVAALAAEGACAWSGHNYAYEMARRLGLDLGEGAVRLGLGHYNTEDEVDAVLSALERRSRAAA